LPCPVLSRQGGATWIWSACLSLRWWPRDLLLDRTPLFWIEHDSYAIAILGLSTIFALLPVTGRFPPVVLLIADALGLGLFSVAGAGYALEAGTSLFIAALMGTITGTFGGVIRDVLCNELPSLFQQTPLYATCAFAGCYFYFLLTHLALPGELAVWITTFGITAFRLAAGSSRFPALRKYQSTARWFSLCGAIWSAQRQLTLTHSPFRIRLRCR